MSLKTRFITLTALGLLVLVAFSGVLPAAHAQTSPSVAVSLSDNSVEQGTAITATMSFRGLAFDSDTSTTDYTFRADVTGASECEGNGLGRTRYMYRVDDDPEVRTGTISASCPAGDYTIRATISTPQSVALAAATVSFTVAAPAQEPTASPTASIALSPSDAVGEGAEITATMSFGGLASDSDASTTDYVFRADVVDADDCEGGGIGFDRYMYRVDEDPETRTGTVSADCPAGAYTLRVSISSADYTELASASAGFFILGAPVLIEPPTLTELSVSHGDPAVAVTLSPAFESGTLAYRAAVRVAQVTVAPTASDAAATVAYLDGNGDAIADADTGADGHQVGLEAGSNTVKVAVSKGGLTTTYTVKLLRLVTQQQNSDVTLVSNTGQALGGTTGILVTAAGDKRAQLFTTGSNTGGYNLASVGVDIHTVPTDASDLVVTVRTVDGLGNPNDSDPITMTTPATLTTGVNTFAAPANTVLSASTAYFIHVAYTGTGTDPRLQWTRSLNEDSGKATGWDIGTSRWYNTTRWLTLTIAFRIQVTGSGTTNNEATGFPTISGTNLVGQTLTANKGTIADADGLPAESTFTYQWIRVSGSSETDISGATSKTYTTVSADQGKKLRVKVGFTDNASNDESRTSLATEIIGATSCTPSAPAAAIWSACLTVENPSGPEYGYYFDSPGEADNFGALSNTDVTVGGTTYTTDILQTTSASLFLGFTSAPGNAASDWVLHIGSASTSFALSAATTSDAGKIYTWTSTSLSWSGGDVISVWIAPAVATNNAATGEPTISGANLVGQTQTANKGSIADADGVPAESTFTYQWIRVSGSTEADITGESSKTYTPVAADQGKKLKVKVSFTDNASNDESRTSSASEIIGATTCTPTAPQDAIWSACLTADNDAHSRVSLGYSFVSQSPEDTHGALSNTEFTVGGNTYTIDLFLTIPPSLALGFTSAAGNAASDWVLHVGSADQFALSAATTSNAGKQYQWSDAGLTWSTGDVISVWLAPAAAAQSSDATLSVLTLVNAADDAAITLTPTFVSGTTHEGYTASVASGVAQVTVTATTTHDEAEAVITPTDAESGTTGHQVSMGTPGSDTVITVSVTAEDGSDKTYSVTVTRAVADSVVALNLDPTTIAEDASGKVTVTATLSAAKTTQFTVTVTAEAVFPATDAAYTLSANTTLTFPASATESTGTVTITPVNNTDNERDKVITVSGAVAAGVTGVTGPADVTLTIEDDDHPVVTHTLTLHENDAAKTLLDPNNVPEDVGQVCIRVTATTEADLPPEQDGTLYVLTKGLTAAANYPPIDYTGVGSGFLFPLAIADYTLQSGRYVAVNEQCTLVAIEDDSLDEDNEDFEVYMRTDPNTPPPACMCSRIFPPIAWWSPSSTTMTRRP